MSGRPRTTSFAEGNKQPPNPVLGGVKISSKCEIPSPFPKTRVSCVGCSVTHTHACIYVCVFSSSSWGSVFSPHIHTHTTILMYICGCVSVCVFFLRCLRKTQLMFRFISFTGTPMFVFWVGETGPRRPLCTSERVQRTEGVRTVVVGNTLCQELLGFSHGTRD